MDTKKLLTLNTHFHFFNTTFLSEFLCSPMFKFCSFLWVCLWSFVVNIFGSIATHMHRLKENYDVSHRNDGNLGATWSSEDDKVAHESFTDSKLGGDEEEKCVNGDIVEAEDSVIMQSGLNSCENKYQFLSNRDVCGFMEGPKIISFTVEEISVDSIEDWMSNTQGLHKGVVAGSFLNWHTVKAVDSSGREFAVPESESASRDDEGSNQSSGIDDHLLGSCLSVDEAFPEDAPENETSSPEGKILEVDQDSASELNQSSNCSGDFNQANLQAEMIGSDEFSSSKLNPFSDSSWELNQEDIQAEMNGSSEFPASQLNCDSESSCDSHQPNFQDEMIDSDEFLTYDEHGDQSLLLDTSIPSDKIKCETTETVPDDDKVYAYNWSSFGGEDDDFIELEPHLQNSDDHHEEELQELESIHGEATGVMDGCKEKSSEKQPLEVDSDDEDELDILQEHRHLVQQMKMEMRYSRVKGLPTISEECETPKTVEDLQPLMIDQKYEYKDRMEEIQKFYKSYAEKMRKLDILNYQTLHAISFLQLKDSEALFANQNSSISFIKPFIPKFWPYKLRKIYADSAHNKSISETHRDLELVYVGQLCLSWEILHWQYAKAKELMEYDSQRCHSFNKVASEYQQFQVLVERFMEDEPFQGPRLQHYVRNRCFVRTLLQIPMIRDDCLKEKKAMGEEEEDAISVAVLTKIIRESMQVFWQFLSAEKGDTTKMVLKASQGTQDDVNDPGDARLLVDIKTSLQQKDRRLKDILRSRNCIVKKFQRFQRGGEKNHALFISQVELKLVSRVLSLPRLTTDQLIWCQRKLDNISFVGGKVHVEPSFCLFPC